MPTSQKQSQEHAIANRFCELVTDQYAIPCHVRKMGDAPDAYLDVCGQEVCLELAGYREQGPHNNSHARDEEVMRWIYDEWIRDECKDLRVFTPNLHYVGKADRFEIPSKNECGKFVEDIKSLIRSVPKRRLRQYIRIRLVSADKRRLLQRNDHDTYYAELSGYPYFSAYCKSLNLHYHPKVQTLLPSSNVDARFTGVDQRELTRSCREQTQEAIRLSKGSRRASALASCLQHGLATERVCGRGHYDGPNNWAASELEPQQRWGTI